MERIVRIQRQPVGDQNFPEQEISIHCVADDLCDFRIFELHKGISSGASSRPGTCDLHCQDLSVLLKIGFELFLIEAVGQMSDINYCVLSHSACTAGHVRLLSGRTYFSFNASNLFALVCRWTLGS